MTYKNHEIRQVDENVFVILNSIKECVYKTKSMAFAKMAIDNVLGGKP
jgi:hypothetical protein